MVKLTTLLSVILLSLYSFIHAQETKVSFDITLNGDFEPDSIYFLFHPTVEIEAGQKYPNPQKTYTISEKAGKVEIEPGIYTMTVLAQGYFRLKTPIIIPDNQEDKNIHVILNPEIIGWWGITSTDQIKQVTIQGDFNHFGPENEIPLVKENNVWILKKVPDVLKKNMRYRFHVDGHGVIDLLNKHVKPDRNWLDLRNIYQGNSELIFDPSLYTTDIKMSQLQVSWKETQNEFVKMVNEWNPFRTELNKKFKSIFSLPPDQQKIKVDSIFNELTSMVNKYDSTINQFLIEKYIILNSLKFMSLKPPRQTREQTREEFESQQKEFLLISTFKQYFKENLNLLQQLDPNSFLLSGDFFINIKMMQQFAESSPQLSEDFNLPENYFDNFIGEFIENSPNKKLCCKLLFEQANMAMSNDEEKANLILMKLQNEYPYEKYGYEGKVNMLLAKINIKLGKPAPDFTADLLNGGTVSLKNYAGKFVFIDFWGSWCAPCRKEIPNLKKLYDSTSRDKLEIIGLAQDKEPDLRKYIADNNIGYPNALASQNLLAKYGITKYPTSFLINPDGRITRIDVRGEDAMNLLKDEINNYFK